MSATKTLSHGGTFTAVTDTAVSGHKITDTTTTFTLPSETGVSVDQLTNNTATAAHAGTITVVTGVTKGSDSSHNIDVQKTVITMPSETAVSVDTLAAGASTLTHGGTFTALTTAVKGNSSHNIDVTPTTFTMPSETSVSVDQGTATKTLSHGGTVAVVTGVAKGNTSHNVDVTTTTLTLPSETALSVDQLTGSQVTPAHDGTFTVVTGVVKGNSSHNLDVTKSTIKLPSVTTIENNISNLTTRLTNAERALVEVGDLREVSHSFISGYTLSGGKATVTVNADMFDTFYIHDPDGVYNVSVTYNEWSGVVADYRILAENTGAHVITVSRKDSVAITSAELSTVNNTVEHINNAFSVYFNKLYTIVQAQNEIDASVVAFDTNSLIQAEYPEVAATLM